MLISKKLKELLDKLEREEKENCNIEFITESIFRIHENIHEYFFNSLNNVELLKADIIFQKNSLYVRHNKFKRKDLYNFLKTWQDFILGPYLAFYIEVTFYMRCLTYALLSKSKEFYPLQSQASFIQERLTTVASFYCKYMNLNQKDYGDILKILHLYKKHKFNS